MFVGSGRAWYGNQADSLCTAAPGFTGVVIIGNKLSEARRGNQCPTLWALIKLWAVALIAPLHPSSSRVPRTITLEARGRGGGIRAFDDVAHALVVVLELLFDPLHHQVRLQLVVEAQVALGSPFRPRAARGCLAEAAHGALLQEHNPQGVVAKLPPLPAPRAAPPSCSSSPEIRRLEKI